MVDLVKQLREVKTRKFSPESLQIMVIWGADEIERLTARLRMAEAELRAAGAKETT